MMISSLKEYLQNNFKADISRLILWYPVLFGLGIGIYFALKQEPSKWLTLTVIEGLIVAAVILRYHIKALKLLGLIALVVLGFTVVQIKSLSLYLPAEDLPDIPFYFKGEIVGIDSNYQGRKRFILQNLEDFDGHVYKGLYRITQRSKKGDAKLGQCVELIGSISPLSKEVVVGGYQFDRKSYFQGLKGSGFAQSRWFITDCSKGGNTRSFLAFVYDIRQKMVKHIKSVLPDDEAAITAAIIAGERGLITQKLNEQYRNSGLAHFLSISGLHMSMLAGLMFFLVRFVLACFPLVAVRMDTKKISAVFAIIISLIYLFISGNDIPAQRAFIMTFVVLLGVLTNRRAISMYTISLAAFLVLLISPEVLMSASFQMSFAAVLGLIAFYEKVALKVQKFLKVDGLNKWGRGVVLYILGVVISDFIASVMTLPFAIYHFNMVALYTTLGNFLAGPIIGLIIMPFVLLSMLLMPFGMDIPFLKVVGLGIGWVNDITAFVSSLPYAGYKVLSMPDWGLLAIVIGGLWLMLWQANWRKLGWIGICVGCLSIFCTKVPDILVSSDLRVFAFKNESGELEFTSGRSGRFIKSVWKNKYPFADSKTKLSLHPELKINGSKISIGSSSYNIEDTLGFSVYKQSDNEFIVKTIREDIGHRLWNNP